MKQQWLLITDEKVIELQVQIRHMDRETKQIRGDFIDRDHLHTRKHWS